MVKTTTLAGLAMILMGMSSATTQDDNEIILNGVKTPMKINPNNIDSQYPSYKRNLLWSWGKGSSSSSNNKYSWNKKGSSSSSSNNNNKYWYWGKTYKSDSSSEDNNNNDDNTIDGSKTTQCPAHSTDCTINCLDDYSCGSRYGVAGSHATYHCPTTSDCHTCTLNCDGDYSCARLTLQSYSCEYVQVNVLDGNYAAQDILIYAPDSDGSLEVNIDPSDPHDAFKIFDEAEIYSVYGTNEININCLAGERSACIEHIIDGRYANYVSLLCDGDTDCDGVKIKCPDNSNIEYDTSCFIDIRDSDLIRELDIEIELGNGITAWDKQVEAKCNDYGDNIALCSNVKIQCENDYGYHESCYLSHGGTVCNGGCNNDDDGGSNNDIQVIDGSKTRSCSSDAKECTINCLNDYSCGRNYGVAGSYGTYNCPSSSSCEKCILNCDGDYSCSRLTLQSNSCKYVQVNVLDGNYAAGDILIYAPDNYGSLEVNVDPSNPHDAFKIFDEAEIYSVYGTNEINVNCLAGERSACIEQIIDGRYANYVSLICKGDTDCDGVKIQCPDNSDIKYGTSCFIDIRESDLIRELDIVMELGNGITAWNDQVEAKCNDYGSEIALCKNVKIQCEVNYKHESCRLFNNGHDCDGGCQPRSLPTPNPTRNPTPMPTPNPTPMPTKRVVTPQPTPQQICNPSISLTDKGVGRWIQSTNGRELDFTGRYEYFVEEEFAFWLRDDQLRLMRIDMLEDGKYNLIVGDIFDSDGTTIIVYFMDVSMWNQNQNPTTTSMDRNSQEWVCLVDEFGDCSVSTGVFEILDCEGNELNFCEGENGDVSVFPELIDCRDGNIEPRQQNLF